MSDNLKQESKRGWIVGDTFGPILTAACMLFTLLMMIAMIIGVLNFLLTGDSSGLIG